MSFRSRTLITAAIAASMVSSPAARASVRIVQAPEVDFYSPIFDRGTRWQGIGRKASGAASFKRAAKARANARARSRK